MLTSDPDSTSFGLEGTPAWQLVLALPPATCAALGGSFNLSEFHFLWKDFQAPAFLCLHTMLHEKRRHRVMGEEKLLKPYS